MAKRKKIRLKKQVKQKLQILALVLFMALIVPLTFSMFKQEYSSEDAGLEHAFNIEIVQAIIPEISKHRPNITREIKYIVIHETDNVASSANASNHAEYLLTNLTDSNSWHYTVDDSSIYHHLPDNEVGWHAGDDLVENGGNRNGVGIEMCVNEGSDFNQTMENAAKLTATLLEAYHLKVDDVRRHQHFSGKLCPAHLLEEEDWQGFLDKVRYYYNLL